MASFGDRTSRITVFIVPPLNVALEICQQPLGIGEVVFAFLAVPMPVVAFTGLVVIAQYAYLVDHVSQPILKRMPRPHCRLRKPPKHKFREPIPGINDALVE